MVVLLLADHEAMMSKGGVGVGVATQDPVPSPGGLRCICPTAKGGVVLLVGLKRGVNPFQKPGQRGDAQDLRSYQERLDPWWGDVHGAHTIEDADDKLDVVVVEDEVVLGQLAVQVHLLQVWGKREE